MPALSSEIHRTYARRGAMLRLSELETEIAMLRRFLNGNGVRRSSPLRRRHLSAALKARLSRIAKTRWRAHRAKHGRTRL